VFALAGALIAPNAFAQATPNPPERMTYQGFLTDGSGVPLGDASPKNYDVIFRIYDSESGDGLIWAEQQTVTVDQGYFSVLLGEGASAGSDPRPNLSTVFAGVDASDRFVGITVKGIGAGNSNVNILPRLRLMASPYSFLAKGARSLVSPNGAELVTAANGELTISGDVKADNISGNGAGLTGFGPGQIPNLDASKVNSGTLSSDRIPLLPANKIPNLDASKITAGTLSDNRLSSTVARENEANTFTSKQTFRGDVKMGPSNAEVHATGGRKGFALFAEQSTQRKSGRWLRVHLQWRDILHTDHYFFHAVQWHTHSYSVSD